MPSNAVPNFDAVADVLQFVNSWPSQPDMVIDLPLAGKLKIGDASNGLCGGMVYTVRDFHEARLPVPQDATQPGPGTPLYRYIVKRLFESFDLPGGVMKYYKWMNMPDKDESVMGIGRRGIAWHTIVEEWPGIRADIDGGHPCPLGLVTVRSADPRALGQNHQVLAYAYDQQGPMLTVKVWDPNTDPASGEGVSLSLDTTSPAGTTPITHNVGISNPVRGFFRAAYSFSDPSALVPPAPLPAPSPAPEPAP